MPITSAAQLLQQHWDGALPVNVEQIAQAVGIHLQRQLGSIEGRFSGCIQQRDDGAVQISLDITESPVRQRFTIAHELGHWALGHLDAHTRCFRDGPREFSSPSEQLSEREANQFAAQLLMPAALVEYAMGHKGIPTLSAMANLFHVSQTAMSYRLRQLGLMGG